MSSEDATSSLRAHAQLYRLVLGQLRADGLDEAASTLERALELEGSVPASTRLQHLVQLALNTEAISEAMKLGSTAESKQQQQQQQQNRGMVFEVEGPSPPTEWQEEWAAAPYDVPIRSCVFSPDGRTLACGAADGYMRLFDAGSTMGASTLPLLTIREHRAEINEIEFHPSGQFIASCSKDKSIRMFDTTSPGTRRSFRQINEFHNIRSINFHPSGSFMLVATDHPTIRIYDVNTSQCFACPNPQHHHQAPVNMVRYAHDAAKYASCCREGKIKIWDTVSNRCVTTMDAAHGGALVSSVQFSKNGNYLLSAGRDSTCRLWDMRTFRVLATYQGARLRNRTPAVFSFDEHQIIAPNVVDNTISVWETHTAAALPALPATFDYVRWACSSSAESLLATCGEDRIVRLWRPKRELAFGTSSDLMRLGDSGGAMEIDPALATA